MKIVYAPQAAADLKEIFEYVEERHPPGALKIKTAIHQSIGLLEILPFIGVKTDINRARMLTVSRYPYLIFYTVIDELEEVIILSVRHSARQR